MAGKTVNHAAVQDILGRAMREPKFREDLLAKPEETLKKEGFEPHADAVRFFKALNKKPFGEVAKHVDHKKPAHDPIGVAGEA